MISSATRPDHREGFIAKTIEEQTAKLPSDTFLWLALGSIARILRPGGWFVFSITHPCFKPPAYGELTDHVDEKDVSYF